MNPDMSEVMPIASGPMNGLSMIAEESFRRGGSLPFKKRKLFRSGSGSSSDFTQSDLKSPYGTPNPSTCFSGGADEKIAALALVAAASSALPVANAPFPGLFLSPSSINEHNTQRMHVIQDEALKERESPESHASSELSKPQDVPPSPMTQLKAKLRIQHPPLRSPLPGGCHGRTARNNSYCRRHPCYNGSKYCKLHYQMHVVSGMRPEDAESSDVIVESARDSPIPAVHTDKRFQGLEGEVKCSATTTRGRPCSYISVNDSRYCFLHADYDSNPPPRRGSIVSPHKARTVSVSSAAKSVSGDEMAPSDAVVLKTPSKVPASVSSTESSLSSAWVTPQVSSVTDTPPSTKKIKDVSTRDGKPVLSSLSYDKWFDKKVMISTGPLANHIGRVVKWGNGWVTVRITPETSGEEDDGLLHNRRAVELFLVPDDAEEDNKTLHDADVIKAMEGASSSLLRCVSREIDIQASEADSDRSRQDTLSPSDELSVLQADTRDCDKPAEMSVDGDSGKKFAEPSGDEEAKQEAPDAAMASASSLKLTKSLPSEEDSVPLVKSLVRAQEQGLRKQGLGLLFGTAALERGRRRVHKPTRYEDTAMLEKARSRLSPEGVFLSPRKRTPVSSPRSPRKSPAKGLD